MGCLFFLKLINSAIRTEASLSASCSFPKQSAIKVTAGNIRTKFANELAQMSLFTPNFSVTPYQNIIHEILTETGTQRFLKWSQQMIEILNAILHLLHH